MTVHLEAFDRLTGNMELPENWDYCSDIHVAFNQELPRFSFTGKLLEPQRVGVRIAIFRYLGKCYATGKVYQLIDVR